MEDDFFKKEKCDRCGGSLTDGRIMSMYNNECICMKCKEEERQRPDYMEQCEKITLADMLEKAKTEHTCCICGKKFFGYGNNAEPVKSGICCDECNRNVVMRKRIEKIIEKW